MKTRAELLTALKNEQGEALVRLSWWEDAWRALDDPGVLACVLWLARQCGKSTFLAFEFLFRLLTQPGVFLLYLAASESQSQSVFLRKLRRPAERLLRDLRVDPRALVITRRSIENKEIGSRLEVVATSEVTTPGRSVNLLAIDEARDVSDDVYTALAPSVIAAQGTILLASTAGAPKGFFHSLATNPPSEVRVIAGGAQNENPYSDPRMLDFLGRHFALISPTAAARELRNEFAEGGDEFLPAALIEASVDDSLGEIPGSDKPAFAFYDLSRKRDLSSRVVVLRTDPQRPEARDHVTVASIRVWDPARSPTGEVDFSEVRGDLADLPRRFPHLERVLVDEGSEAGALLPFARSTPSLTLTVEGFIATVESNMKLWAALAARLHARTISLPRHERLLGELRGLKQEAFAFGSRWRIIDSSRKLHRDLSVSLAGATMAAGEVSAPACDVGWLPPTTEAKRPNLDVVRDGDSDAGVMIDEDGVVRARRTTGSFWDRRERVSLWQR